MLTWSIHYLQGCGTRGSIDSLGQLNPVCNILNCSLTDCFTCLTLERMFSELEVIFQMYVLQQAHWYPCDGDANRGCVGDEANRKAVPGLPAAHLFISWLWIMNGSFLAFPSDLTILHADVFCADCSLFSFFDSLVSVYPQLLEIELFLLCYLWQSPTFMVSTSNLLLMISGAIFLVFMEI